MLVGVFFDLVKVRGKKSGGRLSLMGDGFMGGYYFTLEVLRFFPLLNLGGKISKKNLQAGCHVTSKVQ